MVTEITRESVPDSFYAGNGTVGTSEAKLSVGNFPILKHVVIRADSGNGNTIKVGRVGYASLGFILNAGEQTPPIYVNETDKIGVIGGASGQVFSWLAN